MTNLREMVNTHLPVALKLINSAALVAIAFSTLCAAGSPVSYTHLTLPTTPYV